ncbi:MAG: F0F1 ATP synthase subunit alpha, partial [Nitrospirales bacterium]|nr:F0F1 ATP synthase subunit alpha [Nitrospirales bacterium]
QTKAMKQVAGTLRLDLAQFRELAAFAQFGADLDKSTLSQIERGKRMVEILKQDQYVHMPVELEVSILFAGTQGHLDDIPVEAIKKFEAEFITFLKDKKADVVAELAEKKAIDDSVKGKLTAAIEEFKKGFVA